MTRHRHPVCPKPPHKRRFRDHSEAIRALHRAALRGPRLNGGKTPVRTYRCPACKGWHLTSQPTRPERNP